MTDPELQGIQRYDACTFQDRDGRLWRVYERPAIVRPYLVPRSLVFDSILIVRRVRNFPDNWAELDAIALERLSWQR